jgi:uncharacterized protein YhdP
VPSIDKVSGTMRYAARQLRGLELAGTWMGGPVQIESRRTGSRGGLGIALSGVADAAPLLELLGGAEAARRVGGQFPWNGTLQSTGAGAWQVSLASNLAGVESRLPEPFDKPRSRSLSLTAELTLGPDGVREFAVDSPHGLAVRGQVRGGGIDAHFDVQGVSGDVRRAVANGAQPEVTIDALDIRRAPAVLAAAGALLPADSELALKLAEVRAGEVSLGPLQASLARRGSVLAFSMASAAAAPHQLSAHGDCGADGYCRSEFSADTAQLAALLGGASLPPEWPAAGLQAAGSLDWPMAAAADFANSVTGHFDLATQGTDREHQLSAHANIADGQMLITDLQGTGPAADQVFRGTARVNLVARDYDVTLDYERVALAATAVPSTARARLARAWNAVRSPVVRRGWTDAPETRRMQWHGSWD